MRLQTYGQALAQGGGTWWFPIKTTALRLRKRFGQGSRT